MTFSSPAEKCPKQGRLLIDQEIKNLMVKTGIEQQGFCNISNIHPMPHLNQSSMLPKRTMRNKRFADRIAHISTGFCIKSVSISN
jgi:hypothetical protein